MHVFQSFYQVFSLANGVVKKYLSIRYLIFFNIFINKLLCKYIFVEYQYMQL